MATNVTLRDEVRRWMHPLDTTDEVIDSEIERVTLLGAVPSPYLIARYIIKKYTP